MQHQNPQTCICLRDQLGFRWRGAFGILFLGPTGAFALLSQPFFRPGTWQDLALKLAAWTLFLLGLLLRIWATLYVGGRKTHTLVTAGPFSVCRNPLYLGSFLLALSAGLYLENLTFLAAIGLVALCYLKATVPLEERALRQLHGAAYQLYCQHVPRFWPRPSLFKTPASIEVTMQGLRIEMKRLLLWIWIPALGALLTFLRSHPWWPHPLLLP